MFGGDEESIEKNGDDHQPVEHLTSHHPTNGISNSHQHVKLSSSPVLAVCPTPGSPNATYYG